jgi:GR25 family glycosyltransferase involved in LPS biosynthesis
MLIDLRKTKTVCLSVKDASERRSKFTTLMDNLKFTNWSFYDAYKGKDIAEGCATSQMQILKSHNFSEPLLILEDDVNVTENYIPEIDIDDSIDALYLGYSAWAWDTNRANMSTLTQSTEAVFDKNYYKIKRMLSTHAILYISKHYAEKAIDSMYKHLHDLNGNRHCDVALAKLQETENVYATPKSFFYQDCKHNTIWTKVNISQ